MTRQQKKRSTQALLSMPEIRAVRTALSGPEEAALFEWLYTNGARASEPGLAQMSDVDLHTNRVRLIHLKHGLAPVGVPLAPQCHAALVAWFKARPSHTDARKTYVFPRRAIIDCYGCKSTGKVERQFRDKKGNTTKKIVACPLCAGAGRCPGLTRHDVRHMIVALFKRAGVPEALHFPHVLRHSAVTHLLNKKMLPTAIQQRVGHKSVETTYGYMHATEESHAEVARAFADDEEGDDHV